MYYCSKVVRQVFYLCIPRIVFITLILCYTIMINIFCINSISLSRQSKEEVIGLQKRILHNDIDRILLGSREIVQVIKNKAQSIIPRWKEYKSNPYRVGKTLKCLAQNITSYPVSFTQFWHGFSAMNGRCSLLMVQIIGIGLQRCL